MDVNCSNCNTPLLPGNNICPNCGALNMPFNGVQESSQTNQVQQSIQTQRTAEEQRINDTFIDLDDDDTPAPIITENMAPPALDVNAETSMSVGTSDLTNGANVATYAPDEPTSQNEHEQNAQAKKTDNVDFAIPTSVKPIDNIEMPSDGTAPSIDTEEQTVGEAEPQTEEKILKLGKAKLKINFKSKKQIPGLICIIGIIAFLIIGILLGSTIFAKNVCVSSGPAKAVNKKKLVADGKNNTTKAGICTFQIPKDYLYDKVDGGLLVYSSDDAWRIYIRAEAGLYDDIASSKASIQSSLREASYSVNDIKEMKVGENNMVIIETTSELNNYLLAYMDGEGDYVFYFEIVNTNNNYDYEILEIAADIAKNAKFNEEESKMEKIKIKDPSKLIITASEAHKALNNN